jgi:hypothetical protein
MIAEQVIALISDKGALFFLNVAFISVFTAALRLSLRGSIGIPPKLSKKTSCFCARKQPQGDNMTLQDAKRNKRGKQLSVARTRNADETDRYVYKKRASESKHP